MRRLLSTTASLLLLVSGCATTGSSAQNDAAESNAEKTKGAGADDDENGESSLSPPDGFADARVLQVVSTMGGSAVLLSSGAEDDGQTERVVPIYIGESQAMAIKLRLQRRRYSRPLTHDLLDNIVEELGGEIVKVHIDAIKGGVFVGTVFVQENGSSIQIDARSSDAIALAVGNQVPIFVAEGVFEKAGVPREKFEKRGLKREGKSPTLPKSDEQEKGTEGGKSSEGGPFL